MSKIDTLIRELCPEGVPYFALNEIFELKGGYTPSKSDAESWQNGSVPWFRMEDIRENGRVLDAALQQVHESAVKGGRLFPANSILVSTSATIGEHALVTVPHLSNQRFTSLAVRSSFRDRLDVKFAFYYCFRLADWCRANVTVSSFAGVDMTGFRQFPFPIPPMQVQLEVVRILDTFTELEAELETELAVRRTQYSHIRSNLVGSIRSSECYQLGALVEISRQRVSASDLDGTSYVGVDNLVPGFGGRVDSTFSAPSTGAIRYKSGDILLGNIRPYLRKLWLADREGGASPDVLVLSLTPQGRSLTDSAFLRHALSTDEFINFVMRSAKGAKMPRGDKATILSYEVRVPRVHEQTRIVSILDAFDLLVTDLSVGIPAELAARRKQYEYYRDKLLTFDEAVA